MHNSFIDRIINITNSHVDKRHISWDVVNYETNTVQSFSVKLDALIYQRTLPHATLYFNWYDDLFKNSTFFQEPTQSLGELKKQRALDIRRTYNYVRFWFSGGSDSTTALNAFLDNKIHIDEIVIYSWPDKNVSDPLMSSNRELMLSAIPYLEHRRDQLVNTKITNITLTKKEYSLVLSGPDKLGHVPFMHSMDSGSFLYGLNCSQYAWDKVLQETEHENFCDVFGGTKPKVCKHNSNYYMYMPDGGIPDMALGQRSEDFFICRRNPALLFKTAHLLKKYTILKNMSPDDVQSLQSKTERNPEYNFALGRDIPYNSVASYKADRGQGIYCDAVGETIKNYKNYLLVSNLSVDDDWRRLFVKHQENLRIMKDDFAWIWNLDTNGNPDPRSGYKGHISKLYSMDKFYIADNSEIYKNGFTG